MRLEYAVISLALVAMVVLPLLEALLRKTLHVGISGSAALVQHLTLVVGMVGGVIAAHENRLLALSTLGGLLKGRYSTLTRVLSGACAAGVTAALVAAGVEFVRAERGSGQVLVYGIPLWVVQSIIPAGFGLITFWLVRNSLGSWTGRAAAALLAGVWIVLWNWSPMGALIALGVATLAGGSCFCNSGGRGAGPVPERRRADRVHSDCPPLTGD